MERFLFCGSPILVLSHLFSKLASSNYKNYYNHDGKVKEKVGCGDLPLKTTLLGLPHIAKVTSKSMSKNKFHPYGVFSTRALLNQGRHIKCEFGAPQ